GPSPQGPQPGSYSWSRSITTSEIAHRLFRPERILTLPEDVGLVFHRNLPVIPVKLVKYDLDAEFARDVPKSQGDTPALPAAKSGIGQVFARGGLAALMVVASILGLAAVAHYLNERERSSVPPFMPPAPQGNAGGGWTTPASGFAPPTLYGAGPSPRPGHPAEL